METTTCASGGICISFSSMGIGSGFNNPRFSDRVLKTQITKDSSLTSAEEFQNSKGSPSISALSCRVTTVHINSLILGSQSPFFYKMFSNGMNESEQQAVTMLIKYSEELALLDLLEFLYTHKLKADAPTELLKVLVLADRYQVAACVTFCARALSSFPVTFELASSYLNLPSTISEGDNTHLSSLTDAAKCFLSKNFSTHYEEALELTLEGVEKILSWDTLEVDSEDEVYDFVSNWARTHYNDVNERLQVYSSHLCQLVRFQHMSCEKLKVVLHSEELRQGDATKLVVEALLSKHGNHLLAHADPTSLCNERVYKLRPVEVVVLDSPNQECIIFSMLKKRECITISEEFVGICTQKLHVWDESFYLEFKHRPNEGPSSRKFGVTLWRCTSNSTTDDLKVEVEVAVRSKTTGKFTIGHTHLATIKITEVVGILFVNRGTRCWLMIANTSTMACCTSELQSS